MLINIVSIILLIGVISLLYLYLHNKTKNLHSLYDELEDKIINAETINSLKEYKKELVLLKSKNFSREFFNRYLNLEHLIEHDINTLKEIERLKNEHK